MLDDLIRARRTFLETAHRHLRLSREATDTRRAEAQLEDARRCFRYSVAVRDAARGYSEEFEDFMSVVCSWADEQRWSAFREFVVRTEEECY